MESGGQARPWVRAPPIRQAYESTSWTQALGCGQETKVARHRRIAEAYVTGAKVGRGARENEKCSLQET